MMDLGHRGASTRATRPLRPAQRALGWAALCAFAAALSGCGGATQDLQKQVDALRSELLKTRADAAALGERLDALELRGAKPAAGASTAPASPPTKTAEGDRPTLEVVKLGPGGAAPAPTTAADADDGPPAVLRSNGKTVVQEGGPKAAPGKKPPASPSGDPAANPLDKATKATPRPAQAAAPAPGAKK
jgi:hypothetical protein